MRKRIAVSVVAGAAAAASAAAVAPAAAGPRPVPGPPNVSAKVVAVYGSGCTTDNVAAGAQIGGDTFTVFYGGYLAQAGGSSTPVDARKTCQVAVRVTAPPDVTYAVSSVEHRGYAYLERGANAAVGVGYYFQGQAAPAKTWLALTGPRDDDWSFTDRPPPDQVVFRPCGDDRVLMLTTELRVDKGTSDPSKVSYIAMDSITDGVKTTYRLAWKNCPR
ncbi:DUF4360 domain-containing protein [Actinomadura chibensis]|uniref:DUF4360 domain-containing protein n=1 Tax=Actinomadura chibensis TaxID=392828 RepID=A0A5D0NPV2_9ACTN|nr:DUF4360 domain-containing protein [Actinomadura chibensis]TYB46332.1 DUF4360 domain-containing protein [Actinomadura chibensis]